MPMKTREKPETSDGAVVHAERAREITHLVEMQVAFIDNPSFGWQEIVSLLTSWPSQGTKSRNQPGTDP